MATGVYCILNLNTDKRYVGSAAKSLAGRIRSHRYYLNQGTHRNKHLQRSWAKYGAGQFRFHILQKCPADDCILREQDWIDFYRASDRRYGYNKSPTAGSPLGVKHTQQTRNKVSAALIGKKKSPQHAVNIRLGKQDIDESVRTKMSAYARNRAPEHLANLSCAMKGNVNGVGHVVSKVTRDRIALKAKLRWAIWKRNGVAKEIGKHISNGQRKVRVNHG